jgi:hypothetical protein
MSVTMEQVVAVLAADEPDYEDASGLGPGALPHLHQLVLTGTPELASKAASLAGQISTEGSKEVLGEAARSGNSVVRVAAASAVRNLPVEEASDILVGLVADEDLAVRQIALESVHPQATHELRSRVAEVGKSDPVPHIRELATRTRKHLSN